jgi:glucose-6-phosphate-specific signal transduction histidine kinase
VSSTLGAMTSNNQAHKNQNEDLERKLNQEMNLKLR